MNKLLLLTALISLSGCVSKPLQTQTASSDRVTVLTYNVENLFDTEDDPDKEDETFLPASLKASPYYQNKCRVESNNFYQERECLTTNWSPRVLDRKLSRLTDVVRQVDHGRGPDILIVEEVESRQVLEMWRDKYMKDLGYQTLVYIKGPDVRGINPAIFSRLPMIDAPALHEISFATIEANARPSRGILEAHLRLPNGDPLTVFAVHLPSQGAPTPFRKVAIQTLLDEALSKPPGTNILVGGDFNISAKEEYREKIFKNEVAPHFTISHYAGCAQCAGTIYYPRDRTWSFFDVLLFSKNLTDARGPWQLNADSIHIVNSSVYQINSFGTPARFDAGKGAIGVSDHWPMYAELRLNKPAVVGVAQ